jgi:hypothetical protein
VEVTSPLAADLVACLTRCAGVDFSRPVRG